MEGRTEFFFHFTFKSYPHTMHLSVGFNFDPTGHLKSSANFFWLLRTVFTLHGLGACANPWTFCSSNGSSFEWKKIVPHTSEFLQKWESTHNLIINIQSEHSQPKTTDWQQDWGLESWYPYWICLPSRRLWNKDTCLKISVIGVWSTCKRYGCRHC